MPTINFTSVLRADHQEEFEQLLYFNPNQQKVTTDIERAIDKFGNPRIYRRDDTLRISLGAIEDAGTIFALEEKFLQSRLVGVVIYLRDRPDNLSVVHLAVVEDQVMEADRSEIPLAVRLCTQVTEIARRIKGIATVTIAYSKGRAVVLPVH